MSRRRQGRRRLGELGLGPSIRADNSDQNQSKGQWTISAIALAVGVVLVCVAPTYMLVLRGSSAGNSIVPEPSSWRCVPEYDRHIKTVVLSVTRRDTSLELQDGLLQALPQYTKIILLVPEGKVQLVRSSLQDKSYAERVQILSYESVSLKHSRVWILFRDRDKLVQIDVGNSDTATQQGSAWAQDMFEVVSDSTGRTRLLCSLLHKWYSKASSNSNGHIVPDNTYLDRLSTKRVEVDRLPLAFMGGNILVDNIDGRSLAFCGTDVLRTTGTTFRALGDDFPSEDEITATLKAALNVDRVVLLGKAHLQPAQMYHLDQAMLLLGNGVAAVTKIVGQYPQTPSQAEEIKEAEEFLTELRSTLKSLGYRLVDIETSVQNVLTCQYYINAIPYIDAETGQRTLLMPVFHSAQTDLDKNLIGNNTAVFESLGYKVVHVPTRADELRGGIHCLVNVLE